MKYYLFRDKDNEPNRDGERSYHASGIVIAVNSEIDQPLKSGKDLVIKYFEPFKAVFQTEFRAYNEVELFEVPEHEYYALLSNYSLHDVIY